MTSQPPKKIAFLDTNVLVYLFAFWEICSLTKIPLTSVNGWTHLQRAASTLFGLPLDLFSKDDFADITRGMNCFKRLDLAKSDYDFYCCHVSRSELHHVLLSARAAEEFRRRKVPYTLSNKRPILIHQRVLPHGVYSVIQSQIESFFGRLAGDHGIDIKSVEDPTHGFTFTSEEVFASASKIWSHVLMETMDAYILAAAIECEADCLLTSDAAFLETVNNLRQKSGNWGSTSNALRSMLNKPPNFSFPTGMRPTRQLP